MRLKQPVNLTTDVLVIGGGGVGLRAAIEARSHGRRVLMVSRSRVGYGSNTTISGGGFAAVLPQPESNLSSADTCQQHLRDTVTGGYFLNEPSLVAAMVEDAARQVEDLRRFGIKYTSPQASPWLALSIDPGHSYPRMVYGEKSFGTDFTIPLRQYALAQGIDILEGILITDLRQEREAVTGAMGIDAGGQVFTFAAPAVVLASGGLGGAYARNDNAAGATGDGYAIAYHAGAVLQDMEFVQFYPAGLGRGTPLLFYECLLMSSGGRLLNRDGEDIVEKYSLNDPTLLTRDRLSRAIALEIAGGLGFGDKVVLDLTGINKDTLELLRPVLPKAAARGERRFLVAPTAHFHMGGVRINQKAETSLSGLYAAGEVCTGIHGANRLAGNALTEAWVFGAIAGREAAMRAKEMEVRPPHRDTLVNHIGVLRELTSRQKGERPELLYQMLQETMWRKVGIIRDEEGLKQALREIDNLKERYRRVFVPDGQSLQRALRLGNILTTSEIVCRAALFRCESRGAHYRQDYPLKNDNDWLCNTLITRKDGQMTFGRHKVKTKKLSPPA